MADFCPIPEEQQPIREYEQLKESWFFRWVTLEQGGYLRKILWVGFWGALFAAPISAASYPPGEMPLSFSCGTVAGGLFFVGLVLIRLYLGWRYIRDRLHGEKIPYEESGWYDGQIWQKPLETLNRDRLIVTYQIEPIMKRLGQTFLFLTSVLVGDGLSWFFAATQAW